MWLLRLRRAFRRGWMPPPSEASHTLDAHVSRLGITERHFRYATGCAGRHVLGRAFAGHSAPVGPRSEPSRRHVDLMPSYVDIWRC
jgi:hypothetical protein